MLDSIKKLTFGQKALLIFTAFFAFLAYNIIVSLSRVGETKVHVTVIPDNSRVLLNEQEIAAGTLYLKPGDYTFSASADGWGTATQTVSLDKEEQSINLLPEPESDEAKKWLEANPGIQQDRERLGGENFAKKSQEAIEKNPLIEFLPASEISGPFTIDFGPSKQREGDIFLIVSNSSPEGRLNALKWIRQNGEDPTDYEIIFPDFINPIEPQEEHIH